MKNLLHLPREEKKTLLRRLLGVTGKQTKAPHGSVASLGAACDRDASAAWKWIWEDAWPRLKTEQKLWAYFQLSPESTLEEVERKIAELSSSGGQGTESVSLPTAAPTPQAVTQLAEKLITRVQKGLITEQTVKSIRALGDILDDLVTAQGGEEQEDEPEERQRP